MSILLRVAVSEMTYTVSSGTLNSSIPYHFAESLVNFLRFYYYLIFRLVYICFIALFIVCDMYAAIWRSEDSVINAI